MMLTTKRYYTILLTLAFLAAVVSGTRLTSATSFNVARVTTACISNAVVTVNTDSGAGSLRQAIVDSCDGSTISFSSFFNTPQTITLTSQLVIDKSLAITGPSASLLTISGNNAVRIFNIGEGNLNITISRMSIANGRFTGDPAYGGGIYNGSTGTLNIINCAISGNSTHGNGSSNGIVGGGGIYNGSTGTLNVVNSAISGNSTGFGTSNWRGGGIYNNSTGPVNITNSSVTNNGAGSPFGYGDASGGGIYNNTTATVTILNSNVSGNSASAFCTDSQSRTGKGGGIYNGSGIVNVIESTISGNSGFAGSIGSICFSSANGGGIFSSGTMNVTNSTIAGNSAGIQPENFNSANSASGGGISASGTINVANAIIGNNQINCSSSFGPPFCNSASLFSPDVQGTFISNGYNLIGKRDGSNGFTNDVNNDQVGSIAAPINPLLGTLANNGGITQTMALLPGSPAIDKGSAVSGLTTDQRGLTRPVDLSGYGNAGGGDGSDVGAFEVQAGTFDHLKFNVQPSNTVAGSVITPAVSVTILDGSNNATTSTANVTVAVGTNAGSGTLGGTTTVAAVNGTATFADLSINKSGTGYTLVASSPALTGATSNAFTISCSATPVTLAPSSLPNGTLGFPYTNSVTASGGTAPFAFSVTSGSIPTGLTFNRDGSWSGTPTAGGTFNFTVTATSASSCSGSQAYTVLVNALTINGRVTKGGNGLSGVRMTLSGGQSSSTVTDGNGNYSFGNIAGNASYTVMPSRTNYMFAPTTTTFNNLQANGTADFVGTLNNYSIIGRVTVGTGGLGGVTMTLSDGQNGSALTDGSGNYSFLNIAGDGNYTLTPSLTGFTFNPTNRSFTNLSTNQTLADFAAIPTIRGQIKNSNSIPLSSVVVVLSGTTSATAVSDVNGNFSFAGLTVGGNYVVTPARTNYTFSPALRTFTSLSSEQTADFIGTLVNYTISGRLADNSNAGIGSVNIGLSGSQTATTMTAVDGSYSFTVPGDGNYTITPSAPDYAFNPPTITFNPLSQNQTAANFIAILALQLILDQSGPDSNQAAALDSVLFLRDPFQVVNGDNFFDIGSDRNTRIIIFATGLQLAIGEPSSSIVVTLVDSNNQSQDIAAEDVRVVPNFAFTQVMFRLPDNLAPGTCIIKISAHGQVSNSGTFRSQN